MPFIPIMSYEFAKVRQTEIIQEARIRTPNAIALGTSFIDLSKHSSSKDRFLVMRRLCSAIGDVLINAGASLKRYSEANPTISKLGVN